ncbi:MAG TPA: DUF4340 domain-containing protein, partial [Fimbriimonadaceae bacterium]|nr:DUF4340 domain-containing protein [Fimbriimonadaceae bacterium]
DKKVYVIPNELKNQISKKADDFRDRKLMDVSATNVNRLTIKKGTDEIELEKKDEHWSLVKPLKARGDDSKVGDLVSQATTIRVDTFVTDAANLAAYGLQEPRGTVSLLSEGGSEPVVLQIGSNPKDEKDKEKTYARLSTREAVVLLPNAIEKLLETKPNDLRDKSLVRVESDIVDRITIEPAGGEKLVLARDKEQWIRKAEKDVPIDSAVATRLLDSLKNQQVASFVSDVATDLPGYGLDQPQVKVTLSSFASENTAETQAGEKPIAAVLFGKVEGENVYAKLDDEPFIVAVPKAVLDSIVTDPLQLQPLAIYKHKPEEITWIEVTKADQPPVTLERDKDQWKLAKGDGSVNQINAQSLVNTLGALHAARWAGAVKPEHGLDKRSFVITFKTSTNTTGKLTLGTVSSEDLTPATAEGFTGSFLVSRPDVEAFQLSLLEKPAAPGSASPMPPGAPATPSPTTPSTVAPPATTPPAAPSAPPQAPVPNAPPTPAPEPTAPSPAPADAAAASS